jgi:hypothetical protein
MKFEATHAIRNRDRLIPVMLDGTHLYKKEEAEFEAPETDWELRGDRLYCLGALVSPSLYELKPIREFSRI